MHFRFRNVNDAFRGLVSAFARRELPVTRTTSRYGDVLACDEPVTVTYSRPTERVLFNPARDANPFFHLYESLWMLAGRNDVASLEYYAKRMATFSDDGETLNGAYGYRWRHAASGTGTRGNTWYGGTVPDHRDRVDQLEVLVNHLKVMPDSRRAVLQMWNVEDDLLEIGGGPLPVCTCGADRSGPSAEAHEKGCPAGSPVRTDGRMVLGSKDVCCNLSVLFSLRQADEEKTVGWNHTAEYGPGWKSAPLNYRLDMTVFNRSNDLVWGLLGANYVHFTFLQEYVAARLGAGVGLYHHVSNNLHVYDANWNPELWVTELDESYERELDYVRGRMPGVRLVSSPDRFDRELHPFTVLNGPPRLPREDDRPKVDYQEPFLVTVAEPACQAWNLYKAGKLHQAADRCGDILAADWRHACRSWIDRRIARRQLAAEGKGVADAAAK